jgi:serine/threonine protein kinase
MKLIPKKSLKSLEQEKVTTVVNQLVNEIQIHQALSHPNIVFL